MNKKNGSFKTIYKIHDSYYCSFIGCKTKAEETLFEFAQEFELMSDQKLTFVNAKLALNNLELGIIESFSYFPLKDSSTPYITIYFDNKTEEEFSKEFNLMLNKEGV